MVVVRSILWTICGLEFVGSLPRLPLGGDRWLPQRATLGVRVRYLCMLSLGKVVLPRFESQLL